MAECVFADVAPKNTSRQLAYAAEGSSSFSNTALVSSEEYVQQRPHPTVSPQPQKASCEGHDSLSADETSLIAAFANPASAASKALPITHDIMASSHAEQSLVHPNSANVPPPTPPSTPNLSNSSKSPSKKPALNLQSAIYKLNAVAAHREPAQISHSGNGEAEGDDGSQPESPSKAKQQVATANASSIEEKAKGDAAGTPSSDADLDDFFCF